MKSFKELFKSKKSIIAIIILVVILIVAVYFEISFKIFLKSNYIPHEKISGEIDLKNDTSQYSEPEKLGFKSDSENEKIKDELNIEELKLSNFQLAKADQSILITGEIENTSSKAINNVELKFILYKTSNEGMYEYTMKIPETLEANEKRNVETCIGYRYEDIASLDVELEKIEFVK